jgi:hypothetical protein
MRCDALLSLHPRGLTQHQHHHQRVLAKGQLDVLYAAGVGGACDMARSARQAVSVLVLSRATSYEQRDMSTIFLHQTINLCKNSHNHAPIATCVHLEVNDVDLHTAICGLGAAASSAATTAALAPATASRATRTTATASTRLRVAQRNAIGRRGSRKRRAAARGAFGEGA